MAIVPITDYASLQTNMAKWLRPGATLAPETSEQLPEFIALFEGELNGTVYFTGLEVEVALTATIGSAIVTTPDDYESPCALWDETGAGHRKMMFRPVSDMPYAPGPGYPTFWTIKGGDIALDRLAAAAIPFTFRYRQTLHLTDAAPTNTVLTNYPSLYLYGSLLQSAPFVRDSDMAGVWKSLYDRAEERMMAAENLSKGLVTLGMDDGLMSRPTPFNIILG